MTRVLFVMNAPIMGGAERHTFTLCDQLAAHEIEAALFTMKAGPAPAPDAVMMLQPSKPRSLPSRLKDLSEVIRDLQPDALIAVNERPVLATFIGRRLMRGTMPIIAISHSTILRNKREELMQLAYTPLFNRIESVVFISDNQRRHWAQKGLRPRRSTTILNGIDISRFSPSIRTTLRTPVREKLGFDPADIVIGLCAVMRPEKNHLQLVDAVAHLRQQGYPIKAMLVGDGPMRGAIEERVSTLGIERQVVLTGMRDDVRPFIAAFDIGALCSISIETLSLAALEIMAMGIPMVMSDIGGASEIIDGRNGLLFAVRDDAGLHSALLALFETPTRSAAGLEARRTVEERFDQASMVRLYADHLNDVVLRTSLGDERSSSRQEQ